MYEELVKRLKVLARLEAKNGESVIHVSSEAAECIKEIAQEAADAIEALSKELMDLKLLTCSCCEVQEEEK